ncbi:Polyribonucleotide 5'-hydroxyl-kinase Clp1 [Trypanosoma melophagium]|uniref:Polyribonucleotide 5'-hydroxyl-kinase Clp1 n=1 Tax=Trypanosoma melophagium TaxID=715481 RepID=UPI00351A2E70|nr:Polyribonucleotide 5'-hydroxyl-kinase Clp1 [Trypanosoma melophagium]
MSYQRQITISAGEECTISGSGAVELLLQSGVVEIAGVLLKAREPYVFFLETDQRCVVLYTLEGGSVLATSNTPVELFKVATGMTAVVQLCRRTLAAERRSKVLVIGRNHSGKTLTAHTICNILREDAATTAAETGDTPAVVYLMDLNAQSNCIYAPGCISTVEVEHALWPGTTFAPTLLPFSLFLGEASLPSAATIFSFLHFVEQLHDCTEALLKESGHDRVHLVMDAPAPAPGVKEGVYFRRLIELLRPTHVITVIAQDGSETWSTFLQEDVQRVLPDCEFFSVSPVERRCSISMREHNIREYFVGSPQFPLGCAKMVLPLTQLQFVQYETQGDVVGCRKITATSSLSDCLCAISHAEIIEEVPLAPLAGLMLVVVVDEEHEELVAILPACDNIPRRFIIVPNRTIKTNTVDEIAAGAAGETTIAPVVTAPSLSVTAIMAQIEEAVAV